MWYSPADWYPCPQRLAQIEKGPKLPFSILETGSLCCPTAILGSPVPTQGATPDLHRQPPFMIRPLPISLVSSPPHSPHAWPQTCLAPPGLWACAQVDPGLECPSSPLPVKILLKCHLPCEALPNLPSQIIAQASEPPKDRPATSKEPHTGISQPVFPQHRELQRGGSSQPSVQGEDRVYRAWRPHGPETGLRVPEEQ